MPAQIFGSKRKNCQNQSFENGIVKRLDGGEVEFNILEKIACGRLKKYPDDDDYNENHYEMEDEKESDFVTSVLNEKAKLSSDSAFINCKFLQTTSNLLARLFSKAC